MKTELKTIIDFSPVLGHFQSSGKNNGSLKTYFNYPDGKSIEFDVKFVKNAVELTDHGRSCQSAEERSGAELDEDAWEIINDISINHFVELDEANWTLRKSIENFERSPEYLAIEVSSLVQACLLISNLVL